MLTLAAPHRFAQEIRKSRFLAIATPIADEAEARAFIAAAADPAASHNCWAFKVGPVSRASDDGEPSGTAGRPILQAIEGQGLEDVAVLVVRWFGGILLGSGGLMRAYGGTAAACLREAETIERVARIEMDITCPFADLARLKARLTQAGVLILSEQFDAQGARLAIALPEADAERVGRLLGDITRGRGSLRVIEKSAVS
ncbi:IMPACT family protein [Rhizobium sp. YIM 134829]|uniref:IMPACT family protein n=1 Tax=Rhizobium sp. YIM 134829 TaxID=3390453 RepID=UPI00397D81C6